MSPYRTSKRPFKPRARLLLLLGDQLIRDPGIAVFELVKNAYDADSPIARIIMSHIEDKSQGRIVVEDAGIGMDLDTVINNWLEPGTDYRAIQRDQRQRTPHFKRLPLGEKGVGRFAAHKLGTHIRLISRMKKKPEVIVEIDWSEFGKHKYLSEVPVTARERKPQYFTGNKTGTKIEISDLRTSWTRAMVRKLHRSVTSICSPFDEEGEFQARLVLSERKEWLRNLLTVEDALDFSLYKAHCTIRGRSLEYDYRFTPYRAMDKVEPKRVKKVGKRAMTMTFSDDYYPELLQEHVGSIDVDIYIFDREPRILALGVSDKQGLKQYLDQTGGIRVYRDGIRVYDYGEPGDDWLGLDKGRVNIPTARLSNNIVLGAVSLELESSSGKQRTALRDSLPEETLGLVEKTNREGFVETATFEAFKEAISFAIAQIALERNKDKERIRKAYSKKAPKEPVLGSITDLRSEIEDRNLTEELGSYLNRIEADYKVIRERFLTSASAGLSLMVVIHEVDKAISELLRAVKRDRVSQRILKLARHIADLVEGLGALARASGDSREKASKLIQTASFNTELRLKDHGIRLVLGEEGEFRAKCSQRLIVSTLMNLIDNSIYWLKNKYGQVKDKKRIYVGTSNEFMGGPAIIVADNGPGFSDPPEYLIEPFFTRRPDGMGLGLHLADQVMKVQGGRLEFPESGDVELPAKFDGAVIALIFGEGKWLG